MRLDIISFIGLLIGITFGLQFALGMAIILGSCLLLWLAYIGFDYCWELIFK